MLARECVDSLIEEILPALHNGIFDICIPAVISFTIVVFECVEDLEEVCKDVFGCESALRPQKYFLKIHIIYDIVYNVEQVNKSSRYIRLNYFSRDA